MMHRQHGVGDRNAAVAVSGRTSTPCTLQVDEPVSAGHGLPGMVR